MIGKIFGGCIIAAVIAWFAGWIPLILQNRLAIISVMFFFFCALIVHIVQEKDKKRASKYFGSQGVDDLIDDDQMGEDEVNHN